MTKNRNISDLLDANGDVKSGALDNVPASNDASALTTGTLPIARIADGDVSTAKIADGAVTGAKLASGVGGSLVKISSATVDNDSEVVFEPTGGFADYKYYKILITKLQPASDNVSLFMKIRNSSGYFSDEYKTNSTEGNTSHTSDYNLAYNGVGNNTSGSLIYEDLAAEIMMTNFENNRRHKIFGINCYKKNDSSIAGGTFVGDSNHVDLITGIKFLFSGGNMVSGQIILYGVSE